MPWLKIKLEANQEHVERVAHALEGCGALAVTVEAAASEVQFEVERDSTTPWLRNRVTGLFPATSDVSAIVRQIERQAGAPTAYDVEMLADRDWETAWREESKPMRFGSRLWVCPGGYTPTQRDAVAVFIDPGLAFGSGAHPSTQLCLEWLAHYPFTGEDVIDYGCGCGILAIAALKLGARYAWGVDIDPRALEVSERNAAQNQVADRYRAVTPESLPALSAANIVLANILAQPLTKLASQSIGLLRPGGKLVLAGLLAEQRDTVRSRYASELALRAHVREDDDHGHRWAMLVGTRPRRQN